MDLRPLDNAPRPAYPPRRIPGGLRKVGKVLAGLGICATLLAGGCGAQSEQPSGHGGLGRYVEMVHQDGGTPDAAAPDAGSAATTSSRPQSTGGGIRNLQYCADSPPRLSGDRNAAWLFSCAAELSDSIEVHDFPRWIGDGRLCPAGERAWSRLRVAESKRATITSQGDHVRLTLYAPDGSDVAQLGPQRPCVTLTLEPGIWVLAVEPVAADNTRPNFELFFDEVEQT